MKLRDHYDWVVLGDSPGALLSASMAAKLGLSVLVVPASRSQGRVLSAAGQVLDPEPNYLIGLRALVRSNGLLLECLRRSGMLASEEGHLVRKDDALSQILTPLTRIAFPLPDDDLRFECEREFGKEAAARIGLVEALKEGESEFLRYWYHLPDRLTLSLDNKDRRAPALPGAMKELRKKLIRGSDLPSALRKVWFSEHLEARQFARDIGVPDFENVARGLWFGIGGNVSSNPTMGQLFHLLALGRGGASFRGGVSAFREFLLRLAKRSGAQIVEKTDCRTIFIQSGQFAGVQIANHANMITAGGGILGIPLKDAREKLTISGRRGFRALKAAPAPLGWRFSVSLLVHEEAIPPGVSARMVWQEQGAPPMELEIADPEDYAAKQGDAKLIFLRTVLPFEKATVEKHYLQLIATRMFRQLTEIMPFVEYHLIQAYPNFRGDETAAVRDFAELYGFKTLDAIPSNLLCRAGEGVGSRSGVEGLFVASDESFPDLGSQGGTVAAVEAIAWIAHQSGLAGPFAHPHHSAQASGKS